MPNRRKYCLFISEGYFTPKLFVLQCTISIFCTARAYMAGISASTMSALSVPYSND